MSATLSSIVISKKEVDYDDKNGRSLVGYVVKFFSPSTCGRIRTFDLRVKSEVFYHCAAAA